MKYLTVILLLFSLLGNGIAKERDNDGDGELAKAVLLFYVSNLIDWPIDEAVDTFYIGVLSKESAFTEKLRGIAADYNVHNRPIVIRSVDEFEDPENIQVMFVDKDYHREIDEILSYCQKYHILQVTDRLENKRYTVVNFVKDEETQSIGYEVNKANLLATNLTYQDELLLYGGSLKDLQELYYSTKQLLEDETERVIELSKEIIDKNNELGKKSDSINVLSEHIDVKKDTLEHLLYTINNQNQTLINQSKKFNNTKRELLHAEEEYQKQLASVIEKEQKVRELDSAIKEREQVIEAQSKTILTKDLTIEEKNKVVVLLILLGSTLLFLGVLIFRAYSLKRRINKKLEEKVLERTSEITKVNEELKHREQNYREIFNASADSICIYNLEGYIIDVNEATLKMYGYTKDEIVNKHLSDICFRDRNTAKDLASSYIYKVTQDGKVEFDAKAPKKNGDLFWAEVAISKTNIAGKDCLLSVKRNIDEKKKTAIELESYRLRLEQMVDDRTIQLKEANSELVKTNDQLKKLNSDLENQRKELRLTLEQLKKAQDQLVDSEKMATIGTMAAGVAHEINSPLNYIKGGVFGIKTIFEDDEQFQSNEKIAQLMEGIDLGVDKAAKIVSSLNHFSRQSETLNEDCNIHTNIDNCISILEYSLKYRITIEKNYINKTLICQGNEGKIHQVLLNILTNATQAIADEGTIWIRTGEIAEENKVFVEIKDTGCGIKPEFIDKVTTPFFTTKEVGKGTGLGMAITKKIISDHKGELVIESEVNKGTTMLIYLPIRQDM